MEKIDGVDFLCCDFQKAESKEKILKKLDSKADLLVSDMAADTTGNKDLDCIRTMEWYKSSQFPESHLLKLLWERLRYPVCICHHGCDA